MEAWKGIFFLMDLHCLQKPYVEQNNRQFSQVQFMVKRITLLRCFKAHKLREGVVLSSKGILSFVLF